jgi:phage anti-repressor protein
MDTAAESKPSLNETKTDAIAVDMATKHVKQEKRSEKGKKVKRMYI